MTSEIRTNSLKSRAGLSTVTLTDSGPMFSGITTFVDNSTFSVGTGGTIHAPSTNTLNIGVNNTESLRIDSNSNLKVAGIVTATHFHGDGSNLTGITGTTINSNADNRVITGSGTANTLNAESNFTYDGNEVAVYAQTDDTDCVLSLVGKTASGGVGQAGRTAIIAESSNNSNGQSKMHFRTRNTSNAQLLAMTIDGNQNVGIGITNPQTVLHINNNVPMIRLTDANASGTPDCELGGAGGNIDISADINGEKSDSVIRFNVDGGEKARITSGGYIGIGTISPAYNLDISNSSGEGQLRIDSSAGNHGMIRFSQTGTNKSYIQHVNGNDLAFGPGGSEKLRITSGGLLQLNNDSAKIQLGASQDLEIRHDGSSNRIIAANADLIVQSQNYAIRSENGSTTYLNIKSNGAIALPDGTQGIRFGSAASEDFAIYHSGNNSHIDHFGYGNLYHDFAGDFYMRFYQSAGVVRTALHVSNGGSSNPEFQLRSNPTNAPTNQGTHSPAVRFRGAGWNTNSGSVEVGTILQSEHYYWQSSISNVFGQTYPDFRIKMKNSDNGSYVTKFTFSGNGNAAFTGSLTQNSSDIRLKENIQPITNSLEKVKSLSGFTYNWNKTAQDLGFKGGGHDELQVGLSAQDVEKIQPEVVKPAPVDNTYKTIQYEKLVPLLVEAIKELKAKVETLESESLKLKEENIALRARVTNLEGE